MTDELTNEDELEEMDDEDLSLGDDLLDEVAGEDDGDDEVEGFGHINEKESDDDDDEEDDEEDEGAHDELEEDAEDVDYDSFDDIDEM